MQRRRADRTSAGDKWKKLADRFHEHSLRLAAANRDAATVNQALDRITEGSTTQILDRLAWNETHLSQTRSDPVSPVDADDLASLTRLQLVESGQSRIPY